MCLRLLKSEIETQRATCLQQLVGLVTDEEGLGENECSVVNSLRARALAKPVVDGGLTLDSVFWSHSFCSLKQHGLLFQTVTVPSIFSEDQIHRAGMLWAGVGLNVTRGLVTSKLSKWE